MYKYDIALSYAGEQEAYVSDVRTLLELKGLSVYFAPAPDCQENLLGKNMLAEFYSIFHDQCLLMAAFVSAEYLQKRWTMEEAAIGRMRSREENRNCLIPVYFGDARLPDFDPNIGFRTADKPAAETAHYLAEAVRERKREIGAKESAYTPTPPVPDPAPFPGRIVITGSNANVTVADSIANSNVQCSGGDNR